jgi:hypothetical protein
VIIALMIFAGCAAKYVPMRASGGYSEEYISDNLCVVTFRGNQHNSLDQIRTYLAFRCAELTLEKGYTHYIIEEDASHVETNSEFDSDDLKFEVTSSASGGVNTRVQSLVGPQESVLGITGVFRIRMLYGEDPVHKTASVDAAKFIEDNRIYIKR